MICRANQNTSGIAIAIMRIAKKPRLLITFVALASRSCVVEAGTVRSPRLMDRYGGGTNVIVNV